MGYLKMNKVTMTIALFALCGFSQVSLADAEKVTICHKGVQTASVAASAVSAHQQHGDTLGACGAAADQMMAAVVMMRCEPQEGVVKVTAASTSPSPAIEGGIAPGDDCAAVLAELIDAGYGLRTVTTGTAEDSTVLHLYTDYLLIGKAPVATAP
jgi:hypothetical protein